MLALCTQLSVPTCLWKASFPPCPLCPACPLQTDKVYLHPFSPETEEAFVSTFRSLARCPEHILPVTLMVYGHRLRVPHAVLTVRNEDSTPIETTVSNSTHSDSNLHRRAAMFHFDQLCGGGGCASVPFGPSDYILLAATFSNIFLTHVPRMTLNDLNEVCYLFAMSLLSAHSHISLCVYICLFLSCVDLLLSSTRSTKVGCACMCMPRRTPCSS